MADGRRRLVLSDWEPWMAEANCRGHRPVNDFFPARGQGTLAAKTICAQCDVQEACLEYAITNGITNDNSGIWGATTARKRRELVKERREELDRVYTDGRDDLAG